MAYAQGRNDYVLRNQVQFKSSIRDMRIALQSVIDFKLCNQNLHTEHVSNRKKFGLLNGNL